MTLPIAFATASILTLSLVVLFLVRRLGSDCPLLPVTTEWMDALSTDRYRPMLRMLDTSDFLYLRSQPGFTPEGERRLRRQRVQSFRGYLDLLEADFSRVAAALRIILAHSAYDRPELASLLLHHQVRFALALTGIRFRLLFFRLGLSGVDVSNLLQLFDTLRLDLRTLVPASSPSAA